MIIPGGFAPDYWRRDKRFVDLVTEMYQSGAFILWVWLRYIMHYCRQTNRCNMSWTMDVLFCQDLEWEEGNLFLFDQG